MCQELSKWSIIGIIRHFYTNGAPFGLLHTYTLPQLLAMNLHDCSLYFRSHLLSSITFLNMSMTSPRVLVLPPLSTPSQLTILNERTRIHHLRVEFFGGLKFSSQVGSNNVTFICVFHTHLIQKFIQIWDDTYQRILQATSRL